MPGVQKEQTTERMNHDRWSVRCDALERGARTSSLEVQPPLQEGEESKDGWKGGSYIHFVATSIFLRNRKIRVKVSRNILLQFELLIHPVILHTWLSNSRRNTFNYWKSVKISPSLVVKNDEKNGSLLWMRLSFYRVLNGIEVLGKNMSRRKREGGSIWWGIKWWRELSSGVVELLDK